MSLDGKQISELARVTSVRDDSLLVVDNGGTESNSVYVSDLLKKAGTDKQDKLTAGDNIKIQNNVISADVISDRNIGEIVASVLPLKDAGLHLLDGSLISGSGMYGQFVDYIADLYEENPNASYFAQETSETTYNYVPVGNVIDINGVVTGFDSTSYVSYGGGIPSSVNIEILLKVTPTAFSTSHNVCFSPQNTNYSFGFDSSGKPQIYTGSWSTGSTVYTANQTVWLKIVWDGSKNILYSQLDNNYQISTLPNTWTTEVTWNTTTNAWSGGGFGLGRNRSTTSEFFVGSIDLNNCQIKVNGEVWWKGTTTTTYTPEDYWQHLVSQYGSCGKFVYNSATNTVRLPRIEGFIEGTSNISKLGELVKAGLPNITGRAGDNIQDGDATTLNNTTVEGAFYYGSSKNSDNLRFSSEGVSLCNALCLDASRSNSIYGNSTTVQPQAVKVFYYIIVASSSKNTIGNDGTKIVEDLQYKANNDLSNVVKPNQAFINQSVGWMIPDYKRGISIPRETLQNWVAPATGVLYGRVDWNSTGGWIYVNGYPTVGGVSDVSSIGGIVLNTGDVVTYSKFDTNATSYFYFYPFQGAI